MYDPRSLVLSICSSVFTGISGVLDSAQMAGRQISPHTAVLMQFFFFGFLALTRYGFTPHMHNTAAGHGWCELTTLVFYIGLVAQQKCMSDHPAGFVTGITAGYPLITQLADWIFLKEAVHWNLFLSIFMIAGGALLISKPSSTSTEAKVDRNTLITAAIATFGFGLCNVFEKEALRSDFNDPVAVAADLLFARGSLAVGAAIIAITFRKSSYEIEESVEIGFLTQMKDKKAWGYGALSCVFSASGTMMYIIAMSRISLMLVTIIFSTYPAFTWLVNVILGREKPTWSRAIGIALVVLGAIVAST